MEEFMNFMDASQVQELHESLITGIILKFTMQEFRETAHVDIHSSE